MRHQRYRGLEHVYCFWITFLEQLEVTQIVTSVTMIWIQGKGAFGVLTSTRVELTIGETVTF